MTTNLSEQMREIANKWWDDNKETYMKPIYEEIYKAADKGETEAKISLDLLDDYERNIMSTLYKEGFRCEESMACVREVNYDLYHHNGIVVMWQKGKLSEDGNYDYHYETAVCKTAMAWNVYSEKLFNDIISEVKFHAGLGWTNVTITRAFFNSAEGNSEEIRKRAIQKLEEEGFSLLNRDDAIRCGSDTEVCW